MLVDMFDIDKNWKVRSRVVLEEKIEFVFRFM